MNKGFGIIEMMVAMAILSTALIGAVSLASLNMQVQRQAELKLIAVNLAREGIEVVRNIRDTNRLGAIANPLRTNLTNGTDYTAIPVFFVSGTPSWTLDFSPNLITDSATLVYRVGSYYVQTSGAPPGAATPFRRLLTLNEICSDGSIVMSGTACASKVGIQVLAQVSYQAPGGLQGTSIIEDRLYAWQ